MLAGVKSQPSDRLRTRGAAAVLVVTLHGAVLWLLATTAIPIVSVSAPPVFDLTLAPRPPLAPESAASDSGGSAPAAPSRTHVPPAVKNVEELNPAPRAQHEVQPVVVGLAVIASPTPGKGESGQGDGFGAGVGSGDRPGAGGNHDPVLIQGPAQAVITEAVSRASLYDSAGAHVVLRCRLRTSQRLEGCRVVGEFPRPSGYRTQALARAREFRIKPPVRNGRVLDRHLMTVALAFPPAEEQAAQPSS